MVSESWIDLALNPVIHNVPDSTLIDFARFVQRSGLKIARISQDPRHNDVVVFTEGKVKAKVALKENGFKVLRIFP